jgi:heparin binding hemagglutinin HbhA
VIDMAAKAKFELKTEAQRGLHAGVGAADLAIESVKEYLAEAQKLFESYQKDAQKVLTTAQKSVKDFDFEPKALRKQATSVVSARVEELSKDATARREAVEKRVAELQDDATETYQDLVKRGETVVRNFRRKPASQQAVAHAKTTSAKAKTTVTQAKKSPAKSSAKATGTAARKTAKSATKAVTG